MELTKTKYIRTDLGLIPEDWNLVSLDKIFTFYSTSNFSKAEMSGVGEVGCIHYGLIHAIRSTHYNLKDGIKYYVNSDQAKYELVRDGDVIMVDASEDLQGLNKSVEVHGIGERKFISGLHTYLLRDKESVLANKFRGILLNSRLVKNQMLQLAVGMKVFGVSKTQLVKIKLPLPPTIEEQKAIATALSDVDEYITTLEKLIEKKKAIKQGAMQQLLTPPEKGGKRLPGFKGKWAEINLGKSALLKARIGWQGLTTAEYLSSGDYKLVTGTDFDSGFIDWNNCVFVEKARYDQDKFIQLKLNDVLVTKDGTIGKVALVDELELPATLNSGVFVIRSLNNSFDQKFLYHILMSWHFTEFLNRLTAGSTISHLYQKDFIHFDFSAPPTIEEQVEISRILSDMDVEIKQFENKKLKVENIKNGMMQELLTGKTRLI